MMGKRYLLTALAAVLLMLPVHWLPAQAAARRIMVFFEAGEDVATDAAQRRFLYESLLEALHRENPRSEFVSSRAVSDVTGRAARAREASADAVLVVSVRRAGVGARFSVDMESRFLYTGETVLDLAYEVPAVESERSLALRLWNRGARAVSEAYSTVSREASVVIRGAPGTEVAGLTARPLRLQSEELRLRLPQPRVYALEATSDRHYPQRAEFFLGGRETEILLNQDARSRFFVSAYGQEFSYLGLDLGFLLAPPYVFLRSGFYTYGFGIVPFVDGDANRDDGGEQQLIVSAPLTNFRLLFGTYWNAPQGLLRVYTAGGGVMRVITSGAYVGLEPIAPWGIEIVNGIEFFPDRKFRVFFEHTPTIGIAAKPDVLRDQFSDYSGPEPIYFENDSGYLDLASVRLGVRYQW